MISVSRSLRLSLRTDIPGVRSVVRQFVPVVVGRGVVQLSGYAELLLASLLAVGAVAALGYAQIFYLLPISLFGMSVAAAELPELSRLESSDRELLGVRLQEGLRRIAFFVLPTMACYLVLGDLMVGALLEGGRFGADETRLVWYVLVAYTGALPAATATRLLQSASYASGDTRTPAAVAAIRVVLVVGLGVVLMIQLDRVVITGPGLAGLDGLGSLPTALHLLPEPARSAEGTLRMGAVGLALASAVGAWFEFGVLRRRLAGATRVTLGGGSLTKIALAAGAAALVGVGTRSLAGDLHPLLAAPLAVGCALGAYVIVACWEGVADARDMVTAVRRRLGR